MVKTPGQMAIGNPVSGSSRASKAWRALRPWLNGMGDLIFEPICLGCQTRLPAQDCAGDNAEPNRAWCEPCLQNIHSNLSKSCVRCGAESRFVQPKDTDCRLCREHRYRFRRAVSVGNYHDRLSELVVRMKGLRDETLAWQMGLLLGRRVQQVWGMNEFDLLIPIPCWWGKRLRRGFVASEIIAGAVNQITAIPMNRTALRCCRRTAKQGTLSTPARFRNVTGMFEMSGANAVEGKRILLVDDVMTSGATASQAAGVLRRIGRASSVDMAVLARGTRGR